MYVLSDRMVTGCCDYDEHCLFARSFTVTNTRSVRNRRLLGRQIFAPTWELFHTRAETATERFFRLSLSKRPLSDPKTIVIQKKNDFDATMYFWTTNRGRIMRTGLILLLPSTTNAAPASLANGESGRLRAKRRRGRGRTGRRGYELQTSIKT